MPTLSAKLSWSHYDEILKYNDINKIINYVELTEGQNLSVRQLRSRIKTQEYERLPEATRNKLIKKEKMNLQDLVPNPIIIRNKNNIEDISEKILQK